jgi:hypothetical protein
VEARFARWILDCRRAGNAGSFDPPSLTEHSPDLFPDAPSDTPPGAPPDKPMLPTDRGTLFPGLRRAERAIPQFLRRAIESSPSTIASVSGTQLPLPLAFAPASSSRDGVHASQGRNSADTARSRNAARTSRCDNGEDPPEAHNLTFAETSRNRHIDSGCTEGARRCLKLFSHHNANHDASICDTSTPVPATRAKHPSRRICSNNSAPMNPSARHPSTKFVTSLTSLFTKQRCRLIRSSDSKPLESGAPQPSIKFGTAQTLLFAKRPPRRTSSNNSNAEELSAAQPSTRFVAAHSSLATRDTRSAAVEEIVPMRLTPEREHPHRKSVRTSDTSPQARAPTMDALAIPHRIAKQHHRTKQIAPAMPTPSRDTQECRAKSQTPRTQDATQVGNEFLLPPASIRAPCKHDPATSPLRLITPPRHSSRLLVNPRQHKLFIPRYGEQALRLGTIYVRSLLQGCSVATTIEVRSRLNARANRMSDRRICAFIIAERVVHRSARCFTSATGSSGEGQVRTFFMRGRPRIDLQR